MIDYQNYVGYMGVDPDEARKTLRASNNVQLTEALFEETIQPGSRASYDPVYTLREYEVKGKPSAYQIYINSTDETEAALKIVGSLSHWRKLCSVAWFIHGRPEVGFEGLKRWRKDMADRDRLTAKKALLLQVADGNVSAARALDKMAADEIKRAGMVEPKKTKSGSSSNEDGLEFLNDYQGENYG